MKRRPVIMKINYAKELLELESRVLLFQKHQVSPVAHGSLTPGEVFLVLTGLDVQPEFSSGNLNPSKVLAAEKQTQQRR